MTMAVRLLYKAKVAKAVPENPSPIPKPHRKSALAGWILPALPGYVFEPVLAAAS